MILGALFVAMAVGVTVAFVRIVKRLRRTQPNPISRAEVKAFQRDLERCHDVYGALLAEGRPS